MNYLYGQFTGLIWDYAVAPIQDAWRRHRPSDEDFANGLREIPEIFRFFQHCSNHRIFDANIEPSSIKRGDTVLVSGSKERCNPVYLEGASPQLQKHMQVAESILNYVLEKIPHSPNYYAKSLDPTDPTHRDICQDDLLERPFLIRMRKTEEGGIHWKAGLELAESLEETGVGFCQDLAHVGKLFAWREHPNVNVELVQIVHGCHVFLIIGRDPDSNPLDYQTWGSNCLVCDPWNRLYYPASAIETELYDYRFWMTDLVPGSKITYPYVRRFDPRTQSLQCEDLVPEETKRAILAGVDLPASSIYG